MSDFLSNLIATNLRGMNVLQPRLPSLFEPPVAVSGPFQGSISDLGPGLPVVEPRAASPEHRGQNPSPNPAPLPPASRGVIDVGERTGAKRPDPVGSNPIAGARVVSSPEFPPIRTQRHIAVESEGGRSIVIEPLIRSMRETIIRPAREAMPSQSPSAFRPDSRGGSPPGSDLPFAHAEPAVNVTIGRIEVRALPAADQQRRPHGGARVMGLEEYLRGRARGENR